MISRVSGLGFLVSTEFIELGILGHRDEKLGAVSFGS